MCGITRIINFNQKPVNKKILQAMTKIIRHRGPDDEGYFIKDNVGLGHCRLSIIDLSQAGHQPMANKNKTLWISYNGEIYNYLELRQALKKLGHRFQSNTDTEIVLHAYEEWQENCLNKFNGMWAFAIWDDQKRELFCARDRFAIKPFYYCQSQNNFAFASEIKSLFVWGCPRQPHEALIYDFLKFGIVDHTQETFFRGVKKIPPASWLKINHKGLMAIKQYWDFDVSDQITSQSPAEKEIAQFRQTFIDAVNLRLRSDVPLGSCLSGGLDSSSIVCVVNRLIEDKNISSIGKIQETFSVCFEDKKYNERKYIAQTAKIAKVNKNYIFPKPQEYLKSIDSILWHQEEPFFGTDFPQWQLMKAAKQKVKILLDGQGGDENLCGYKKFYLFYLRKLFENYQYSLLFNESTKFFLSLASLKDLALRIKPGLKYFKLVNKYLGPDNLFNPRFAKQFKERKLDFGYQKNIGEIIKSNVTTWSLPALLRYEDKNSMAHSLETRLPFLDYRLVELAASLPLNLKMQNGWSKFILRQAMKDILPEKIRLRKSKIGFAIPQKAWLKTLLRENMETTIKTAKFLPNYISKQKLIYQFKKSTAGKITWDFRTFMRFYILELWARKFILNHPKLSPKK